MGTQILGNTAAANAGYNHGVSYNLISSPPPGISSSTPIWIDNLYFYFQGNSGNIYAKLVLINGDASSVIAVSGQIGPIGTTEQYYGANVGYKYVGGGTHVQVALLVPSGTDVGWGGYNNGSLGVKSNVDYTYGDSMANCIVNPGGYWDHGPGWYMSYFPDLGYHGISPNVGSGTVGSSVVISGISFSAGVNSVTLNGTGCSFSVQSDTQLTFTVPAGAGSGTITVNTNAGSASWATFYVTPTYSSLSTYSGVTGSTVYFYGSGFEQVNGVYYNGVGASYTVNSDSQITTTVPAAATTGQIHVATTGGNAYSSTFGIVPTFSSFSPTIGPPGTTVTLTGTGFDDATGVSFNGTPASFTINSATQITTTVPQGATNGPITITTNGGSVTSSANFIAGEVWYGDSSGNGVVHYIAAVWYGDTSGVPHKVVGVWVPVGSPPTGVKRVW